ncbi:kinase-like protein [Choiromyces venosus 120613-1]|uniref:Kinase-like protein n=1 Tax=Choiromyces venosus 120613-1 TaxID=1336337 RepID=A0A3N4JU40_9PEZI|nr:kinase-like protein [Choiromyces venosus 120613-1]
MNQEQSDLVIWYKLQTEFFEDHVIHTKHVEETKDRNKKVKEYWSNCGELGEGGFGVVHKQVEKSSGHCRAVKTIDKRRISSQLDYSRELLVMAILAKDPTLFVRFLGWWEEPETLYIAMEYLEHRDLTKHMGTQLPQETVKNISKQVLEGLNVMHQKGIAHRDLKPANIFVVSLSPVWVKLGDFGISKRIQVHAPTTFHTQVSTQAYSAPEVLGLDSNSETSDYTNAVDIWSLGCVIYELLVGSKLFFPEGQVSRYFFGKWPFPEDKLKGLSPPISDDGVSLLKSMVALQPVDRPTAKEALDHTWLMGLKNDNEDNGGDQGDVTQSQNGLATRDNPVVERSEINRIIQEHTKDISGDVDFRVIPESQSGSDPKSAILTSVIAPPEAASVEGSPLRSESTEDASKFPGDSPQGAEEEDPQNSTDMSPKPPASDSSSSGSFNDDSPRSTPDIDGSMEHTTVQGALTSILEAPTTRLTQRRTYPTRASRFRSDDSETSEEETLNNSAPITNDNEDGGSQNGSAIISLMRSLGALQELDVGEDFFNEGGYLDGILNAEENFNARDLNEFLDAEENSNDGVNLNGNSDAGQDTNGGGIPNGNPNAGAYPNGNPNIEGNSNGNPNAGAYPNGNPNIGGNSNGNPNAGAYPNGNPNVGRNSNGNPNAGLLNPNAGGNPLLAWNRNAGGNSNLARDPNPPVAQATSD